jgi:hypothetical protein
VSPAYLAASSAPRLLSNPLGAADKEGRRTRFMQALQNMKTLAEGRKLN